MFNPISYFVQFQSENIKNRLQRMRIIVMDNRYPKAKTEWEIHFFSIYEAYFTCYFWLSVRGPVIWRICKMYAIYKMKFRSYKSLTSHVSILFTLEVLSCIYTRWRGTTAMWVYNILGFTSENNPSCIFISNYYIKTNLLIIV